MAAQRGWTSCRENVDSLGDAGVLRLPSRYETRRHADQAVLQIEDTGIGIDTTLLPRVFEMFTQADRTLDRSRGSRGLGLALVKGLTELHGGRAGAASGGAGQGATFTVWLPLAADSPATPEATAA